jgi:hypothetical protein
MTTDRSQASRAAISRALIVAGGLIGITMGLKLLAPAHLSQDTARRILGVLLGAVVVVYANAIPKALSPLVQMLCEPATEQALRRFTGWSLVLGGAAYAVAWAVAPLTYANVLATSLLGTALLLVVLRFARALPSRPRG